MTVVFSLCTEDLAHCLLASMVGLEKSAVHLPELFEGNMAFFSVAAFKLFSWSFWFFFCGFTIISTGVDFCFSAWHVISSWQFSALILQPHFFFFWKSDQTCAMPSLGLSFLSYSLLSVFHLFRAPVPHSRSFFRPGL